MFDSFVCIYKYEENKIYEEEDDDDDDDIKPKQRSFLRYLNSYFNYYYIMCFYVNVFFVFVCMYANLEQGTERKYAAINQCYAMSVSFILFKKKK